jgi:hypothetical protein
VEDRVKLIKQIELDKREEERIIVKAAKNAKS